MWHTPPGNEQSQTTLLSNIGLWDEVGVTQLVSLLHGSTLLFQSLFPTCVAISSKASTAGKKKNSFYVWISKKLQGRWYIYKIKHTQVPSSEARSPACASSFIAFMQKVSSISKSKLKVILKISETAAAIFFLCNELAIFSLIALNLDSLSEEDFSMYCKSQAYMHWII